MKEAVNQTFDLCKFDHSNTMKIRCMQFYELLNTKHGCILVGEPQSGKSALVHLLRNALDKAAMNEYMLAVQDKRREALLKISKDFQAHAVESNVTKVKQQFQDTGISNQIMGNAAKSKAKKSDREAQNKKMLNQLQDLYKKTKLTEE